MDEMKDMAKDNMANGTENKTGEEAVEVARTAPAEVHHVFSPSRLQRYSVCPGAFRMEDGIAEEAGEAAQEGTRLHEAVAKADVRGLDGEQAEAVTSCIEFLSTLVDGDESAVVHTEQPVEIRNAEGEILTTGTCDAVVVHGDGRLQIVDWKFGRNPVEEVSRNLQLAAYAAGALQKYGGDSCECHVFQPRIKGHSFYTFSRLWAIIENIGRVIARCNETRMVLNPSDQCQYCKGRGRCPAFQAQFTAVARREPVLPEDPDKLAELYEKSKLVEKFCKDIKSAVEKRIEETGSCGKYVFKTRPGNRVIGDISAAYGAIRELVGETEFLRLCKVSVPGVIDLVAGRLAKQAEVDGNAMTMKDAKAKAETLLSQYIQRDLPTHTIAEAKA